MPNRPKKAIFLHKIVPNAFLRIFRIFRSEFSRKISHIRHACRSATADVLSSSSRHGLLPAGRPARDHCCHHRREQYRYRKSTVMLQLHYITLGTYSIPMSKVIVILYSIPQTYNVPWTVQCSVDQYRTPNKAVRYPRAQMGYCTDKYRTPYRPALLLSLHWWCRHCLRLPPIHVQLPTKTTNSHFCKFHTVCFVYITIFVAVITHIYYHLYTRTLP